MEQMCQILLTATGKNGELDRDEKLNWNMPAHFSKLTKIVFYVQGTWHAPDTTPSMVHSQGFCIMT
jgi:hypothetical protein